MKKKKYLKDEHGLVVAKMYNFPCDYWKLCERVVIPDYRTGKYYRIWFSEDSVPHRENGVIVYLQDHTIKTLPSFNCITGWNFLEELTEEHDSVLDIIGAVFVISFDGEDYETRENWESVAGCDKYPL